MVSSILPGDLEQKPTSGHVQAHIHTPVPPALPILATFSLPSCSKQLMRKLWRQRVQGKT